MTALCRWTSTCQVGNTALRAAALTRSRTGVKLILYVSKVLGVVFEYLSLSSCVAEVADVSRRSAWGFQ